MLGLLVFSPVSSLPIAPANFSILALTIDICFILILFLFYFISSPPRLALPLEKAVSLALCNCTLWRSKSHNLLRAMLPLLVPSKFLATNVPLQCCVLPLVLPLVASSTSLKLVVPQRVISLFRRKLVKINVWSIFIYFMFFRISFRLILCIVV